MSLRIRTSRFVRRRVLVAAALLVLAGAVAYAHLGPGMSHMGMGKALAVCLAVTETAALGALLREPTPFSPLAARSQWTLPAAVPTSVNAIAARAGPAKLQVFLR